MYSFKLNIALMLSLCGFCLPSYAQSTQENQVNPQQNVVPKLDLQQKGDIKTFEMRSAYTPNTYSIQVYIPNVPAPKQGYAVLYLLDGNASFPAATQIAQSLAGGSEKMGTLPVVIVGIGYVTATQFASQPRSLDYTPKVAEPPLHSNPQIKYGGADQFLKFIQNELKPRIEKTIPINQHQQTLFGHSFGGLFALHTLFTAPQSFNRYVAASPSIWFDQTLLTQQLFKLPQKISQNQSPILVMTTVGTNESKGRPPRNANAQQNPSDFFKNFQSLQSGHLNYWHFNHPAEQHITNLYASLPKALLMASCADVTRCQTLFNEN